jgi:hypothetical protein
MANHYSTRKDSAATDMSLADSLSKVMGVPLQSVSDPYYISKLFRRMQEMPGEREANASALDLLNTRFGSGCIPDDEIIFKKD